jgi:uncharacterized repeat protein (TIGR03803 family)
MQLAVTNSVTKGRLNISAAGPRIRSTRVAAAVIHSALTLAVLSVLLLGATRPAQAQGQATLYTFTGTPDGANPQSRLTFSGGNLYGTTYDGGLGFGTVFELAPDGTGGWTETVLYSFCSVANCADGQNPTYSHVTFDSQGNLYGTAFGGGANGFGVVFELSPGQSGWTETVLYSFANSPDGANPVNGLLMDAAGNLYGTTFAGGSQGNGAIYELSPSGGGWTEKVIVANISSTHSGLTMDAHGNIFGTTYRAVFKMVPTSKGGWNLTKIFNFPKIGTNPNGTPVLDSAGNVYGTTFAGGVNNDGMVYKLIPGAGGTWTEQVLHSFGAANSNPLAGLAIDSAGNLYGTTSQGGLHGDGTVFALSPNGSGGYNYKVLQAFTGDSGNQPYGSMILAGGYLFGTTFRGGLTGDGVVYEVDPTPSTTTTTLTISPNPSNHGHTVTFTATVTPAPADGELITFEAIGQGPLIGGKAIFQTSTLPVGTTKVRAIYFGDLNLLSSRSIWHYAVVK